MTVAYTKSVVVFTAHPDDAGIICAGTLALLAGLSWTITICSLTGGSRGAGGSDETVARAAAAMLGAEYLCLGEQEGYLYDTAELRIKALSLIRQKQAGMVITHLPNDYHSDHRATCAIVEAAAMQAAKPNCPVPQPPLARTPVLYHASALDANDPLGNAIIPAQFFVDIGSVAERKSQFLIAHKTEELLREAEKQDRLRGKLADCDLSEAWWQHLGGGFPRDGLMQDELSNWVKLPFNEGADHEP